MAPVNVRYIVNDVQAAVSFYVDLLNFELELELGPSFAILRRGDLHLLLNLPGGGGGAGEPVSGTLPQPGGWNRFQLIVTGLDALVAGLEDAGAIFRSEVIEGRGGRQVLLEDPSGNPVELFEFYK
jgi:catechol 2,3-dioxygenase-like lactoylglutathione lyase family enzyme